MALITFPRDLPAGIPLYCTGPFEMVTMGEDSVTQGGAPLVVETGPSLIKASFATPPLGGSLARVMQAWIASIKTPPQPFWAPDLRRQFPAAYQGGFPSMTRAAGGSFDGTCQLDSIGVDGFTVNLKLLPVGFTLSPGDAIAFDYNSGTSRAWHRIVSDAAVADGSGDIAVEVRPVVQPGTAADATVYLQSPKAKFNLVRGSDKAQTTNTGKTVFTFDGMQTLA